MKHTPGPWKIRYAKNLTAIVTPKGEMQLSLHGVHDGLNPLSIDLQEWKANARLIAAAPELFEACKFAKDVLDGYDPPIDDEPYQRFVSGMTRLNQAISMAEKVESK